MNVKLTTFLLIILAVLGGYFMGNHRVSINRSEDVADGEDATPAAVSYSPSQANWKTYRNEALGFAFDYPLDFSVQEKDGTVILKNRSIGDLEPQTQIIFSKTNGLLGEVVGGAYHLQTYSVARVGDDFIGTKLSHATGDADSRWSTYFFTKEQPNSPRDFDTRRIDFIRADVETVVSDEERQSITDGNDDAIVTEADRIVLSLSFI